MKTGNEKGRPETMGVGGNDTGLYQSATSVMAPITWLGKEKAIDKPTISQEWWVGPLLWYGKTFL